MAAWPKLHYIDLLWQMVLIVALIPFHRSSFELTHFSTEHCQEFFLKQMDILYRKIYMLRSISRHFRHCRTHYHCLTYKVDHLAGADAVIDTHPALVLRIFPSFHNILVAHVVGPLIHNPGPALHPDRVASAQVGLKV